MCAVLFCGEISNLPNEQECMPSEKILDLIQNIILDTDTFCKLLELGLFSFILKINQIHSIYFLNCK